MLDGIKVKLGGREYVIPPLNLKGIRAMQARIEIINKSKPDEIFSAKYTGAVADVIHTALVRNYPDVTREEMEDILDLANVRDAYHATMNVSGLVKKPGEATGPESL